VSVLGGSALSVQRRTLSVWLGVEGPASPNTIGSDGSKGLAVWTFPIRGRSDLLVLVILFAALTPAPRGHDAG
jgi:hypothetical protein